MTSVFPTRDGHPRLEDELDKINVFFDDVLARKPPGYAYELSQKVEELRAEVARLRAENDQLRRLVREPNWSLD